MQEQQNKNYPTKNFKSTKQDFRKKFPVKSNSTKSAPTKSNSNQSSWEPVEKWYRGNVGEDGHYYHQHVVLPGVFKLFDLPPKGSFSVLDVACGQGVLARRLSDNIDYIGVDISPSLVKTAKSLDPNAKHRYFVYDATKSFLLDKTDFTHAAIVLAIQNMEKPEVAFLNIAKHLIKGGCLVIAMNHPCFRIPRQSSWKVDEAQKIQYRRVDSYSSPLQIPIQTHPSQGEQSTTTWSYHYSLAAYSKWLSQAGFAIELIDEWHSNKTSTGGAAKMENRSRQEIPLFLAIKAIKL